MSSIALAAPQEGLTCAQATALLGRSRAYTERLARIRAVKTFVSPSGRVLYDKADVEAIAAGQHPSESSRQPMGAAAC
jgi:hypothetical protein